MRTAAAPPKSVAAFVKDSLRLTDALSLMEKAVTVVRGTMAAREQHRERRTIVKRGNNIYLVKMSFVKLCFGL